MGVALVSDLSDKIVRYGIPRGFIPGIVKGCPLDRVQQRRTRHAAFLNALFPIRVDGSWGREKLLFTRKEVFPFPKPQPFSRKAGYFVEGMIYR